MRTPTRRSLDRRVRPSRATLPPDWPNAAATRPDRMAATTAASGGTSLTVAFQLQERREGVSSHGIMRSVLSRRAGRCPLSSAPETFGARRCARVARPVGRPRLRRLGSGATTFSPRRGSNPARADAQVIVASVTSVRNTCSRQSGRCPPIYTLQSVQINFNSNEGCVPPTAATPGKEGGT